MFDLLFRGGLIVDGSGGPAARGDVAVAGGKIAAAGAVARGEARRVIELEGRVICPGFLDIHRHADFALLRPGFGEAELRQGITTIVNGCCGLSAAPLPPSRARSRRERMLAYLAPVTGGPPPGVYYETFSQYAGLLRERALPLNAAVLAGSGSLRAAVAGYGGGPLDREALAGIRAALEDALGAGAPGVSVGLSYLPDAAYAPKEMAAALAPAGGLPLVCHVRGEGDLLYESVQEVIEAAGLLGSPLHISHFKCIGRRNWGALTARVIDLIERTRERGMAVTCDVYPWTAGSTQMLCLLPPAFCEGGPDAAAERLRDAGWRAACREVLSRPGKDFENIVYGVGWESIYVAAVKTEKNQPFIGKNVAEIAALRGSDPYEAAFDLLAEEDCEVTMVDYIACAEDIDVIARLPYASIISDALYSEKGRPHPRCFSNVPRVFHELVWGRRALGFEEAVHKMTGLPARTMGFSGKGFVRAGYDADLVVFRPENIPPPADYADPRRLASGIDFVFVAGEPVLEGEVLTGARPGRYIGPAR